MRDLLVLAVVYGSLPLIPFRPFVGVLVVAWLAYMRPVDLAWSIGATRLSHLVALATVLGVALSFVARKSKLWRHERLMTLSVQSLLLIALGLWIWVTTQTSIDPVRSDKWCKLFLKIVAICLLTTGLVRSRQRYRILVLVIAGSLGLLGFKYGLWGLLQGGVKLIEGPGGFMQDVNALALAMNMAIPLLVAVALTEQWRLLRWGALTLALLCMLTVVFTFSRGGFVALAVVVALLILRSQRRLLALVILAILLAGSALLSDEVKSAYLDRLGTIDEYEEDASATGRLQAWGVAVAMWKDYPIFGVGPENFLSLYRRYSQDETRHVAHNSFFQLLAENGAPAAGLFVALIIATLVKLQHLAAVADSWTRNHARMLQISLVAYATGGMLLDQAYSELFYHLAAMSVCLEVASGETPAEVPSASPVIADELPWYRRDSAPRPGPV